MRLWKPPSKFPGPGQSIFNIYHCNILHMTAQIAKLPSGTAQKKTAALSLTAQIAFRNGPKKPAALSLIAQNDDDDIFMTMLMLFWWPGVGADADDNVMLMMIWRWCWCDGDDVMMLLSNVMLMIVCRAWSEFRSQPRAECSRAPLAPNFGRSLEQNVVEHPLRPAPADVLPHPTESMYYWSMLWCSMFYYCFDATTLLFHVLLLWCSMFCSFAVSRFATLTLQCNNESVEYSQRYVVFKKPCKPCKPCKKHVCDLVNDGHDRVKNQESSPHFMMPASDAEGRVGSRRRIFFEGKKKTSRKENMSKMNGSATKSGKHKLKHTWSRCN